MTTASIGLVLLSAHLLTAGLGVWLAWRSRLYPAGRLAAQALLATLIPIIGPAWVVWMLGESRREVPKPTTNAWHPLDTGRG